MEFCDRCDGDFHKPASKRTHVRKARFPTSVADILRKCEKEGKASDYGASKPEGKNILKYVLEYEEGYWYLFKNNSTTLHLDAELEFKVNSRRRHSSRSSSSRIKHMAPDGSSPRSG